MEVEETWAGGLADAAKSLWSVDLADPRFQPLLEPPSDPKFGDAASGVAFRLAKDLRKPPRAIAEELAKAVAGLPYLERAEVAGAGYVNFRATRAFHGETILRVRAEREKFGRSPAGGGRRVLVEHCSANPTGPLHIAHGRQAAVGDALANLLDFAGYRVDREFYVNDTGGQIENLGRAILWRYLESIGTTFARETRGQDAWLVGHGFEFLEKNLYRGDYVSELAAEMKQRYGDGLAAKPDAVAICGRIGKERLLEEIRKTLEDFRVRYDTWYSQEELEKSGRVEKVVEFYRSRGLAYEKDGAQFFKSKEFGDPEDRVLVKSDGSYTYRTPDIAYHRDKFERGFETVIDLWGPDHHAHVATMEAGLRMLDIPIGTTRAFRALLVQHCRLLRGGAEVKMSKRAASYVTLRELIDEVGVDAARYFFIMRKTTSHLDFDIEVAKRQTLDNPVYYAQYAHARICGICEQGRAKGMIDPAEVRNGMWDGPFDAAHLSDGDIELVRACRGLRRAVEAGARDLDPAIVTDFVYRLSGAFQRYYQKFENTVLTPEEPLRRARLAACGAVRQTLRNALAILGVSAPERL
ncbi:MAG: arginine--tRNA ligase [Planctomycetes bacterium]|nr:arginine--tRNA ligase [Planctomycetota bacterium]